MFDRATDRQGGFTLLEMLVSMTIFLAVMTAALSIYSSSRRLYARGERQLDVQQNARLAMSEMTRAIRLAGFFPENHATPAAVPALADPIRIATDETLAIYGDTDGTGVSNVFLYCLDGDKLRRRRADSDVASAYTCYSGDILAEHVTDLRFSYYQADGTPVPDPATAPYVLDDQAPGSAPDQSDTTQRALVSRVVISLTTRQELAFGDERAFTLSSDVQLRNLR